MSSQFLELGNGEEEASPWLVCRILSASLFVQSGGRGGSLRISQANQQFVRSCVCLSNG